MLNPHALKTFSLQLARAVGEVLRAVDFISFMSTFCPPGEFLESVLPQLKAGDPVDLRQRQVRRSPGVDAGGLEYRGHAVAGGEFPGRRVRLRNVQEDWGPGRQTGQGLYATATSPGGSTPCSTSSNSPM